MSTVSALETVTLDPGDMGLVFIAGVGFRPAEGADLFHGQIVENVCVIKCHVGYDDLPVELTNYVPMCGGEGGLGKWAGKWETPLGLLAPPVWYTAPPADPLVPVVWDTPYYSNPYIFPPYDPPWTSCCATITTITTDPPDILPADLPPTAVLFGSAIMIAIIITRFGQTMRLLAEIKRTS